MDCTAPSVMLDTPMLAIVSYPTLEELRANQDKPGIREYVEQIDAGLDKFAREKLREPEQLPEIDEDSITPRWDTITAIPMTARTLIKHGDTVIFSEPARWEEYERFAEVAEILKAKYGHRLRDLVPTPRSEDWLYGDKYSAPDTWTRSEKDFESRAVEPRQGSRFLCFDLGGSLALPGCGCIPSKLQAQAENQSALRREIGSLFDPAPLRWGLDGTHFLSVRVSVLQHVGNRDRVLSRAGGWILYT